jgi:hypothetical protein
MALAGHIKCPYPQARLDALSKRECAFGQRCNWDTGEFGVHRIAIFRDPAGTTLELIEQPEAPGSPTPPDFG